MNQSVNLCTLYISQFQYTQYNYAILLLQFHNVSNVKLMLLVHPYIYTSDIFWSVYLSCHSSLAGLFTCSYMLNPLQLNPLLDGCIQGGSWLNLSTPWDATPREMVMPCFPNIKPGSFFPGTGLAIFNTSGKVWFSRSLRGTGQK